MSIFQKPWFRYTVSGAAAGFINGLFGAGGGMILIPLLIRFCKLDDRRAFSSSIFIILPLCIISLIIYCTNSLVTLSDALPYLIGGLLGGIAGGLLFRKASLTFLHKTLGIVIIWGGIRLLW